MSPPATVTESEAIAALQKASDDLFYTEGISGVTVAAIRDASGVSLRRIYELCPSKGDLVSLWLRSRHETWTESFTTQVEVMLESGADPVDAVFGAIETWMTETEFRGCGFINTHAEIAALEDEHVHLIRDHKRSLAAYLDKVTGHGDAMAALVDGAIIQASMFASPEPIHSVRAAARILVRTVAAAES